MSPENASERKRKRRLTLIFVPDAESESPRTFSFTKWGLIVSLLASFFGIVALIVVALTLTPTRRLLSVSDPGSEQQYGKQIIAIQEQVSNLLQEMTVLRNYNLRLRKALGEQIAPGDSNPIPSPVNVKQLDGNGAGSQTQKALKGIGSNDYSDDVRHDRGLTENPTLLGKQQQEIAKTISREFPLSLPVDGYVSRTFDAGEYHYGIDFVGKVSTPVLAAADGNVLFAGWTYDDGFTLMIAHALGYVTVYKHNEVLMKNVGSSVKRGEVVALLGNTGKTSSGPHLHFEIWKDGIPYNPASYLLTTQ